MRNYKNYHDINTNAKISHDGKIVLDQLLDGFESYLATINNEQESRVALTSKYNTYGEVRGVIGRIEDIERGNLINIEGNYWLVVSYPDDNKIYRKADIKLCNTTFHLELDKTTVLLKDENGNPILDNHGRPIYKEVPNTKDVPCVVETKYYFNNRNEQITLPEDRVMISIQYQEANNLKENAEFNLYNSRFSIKFIDYTKVVNDKGVMIITGERVMKKDGNV